MIQFSHFRLKKGLAAILLSSITCIAMAQTDSAYRQLPGAKQNNPLFIINNNIIGVAADFIKPQDIASIEIFKDSTIPARLYNLGKYGIVAIHLKKAINIKARSFNEVKEWLNIIEDVKFAVDGFYVDDTTLLVSIAAICQVDIIKKQDGNKRVPDVINIWTIEPRARKGYVPGAPRPTDKPGEIYIR